MPFPLVYSLILAVDCMAASMDSDVLIAFGGYSDFPSVGEFGRDLGVS